MKLETDVKPILRMSPALMLVVQPVNVELWFFVAVVTVGGADATTESAMVGGKLA